MDGIFGLKGITLDVFIRIKWLTLELLTVVAIIGFCKAFGISGQFTSYCILVCILSLSAIWDIQKRIIPDAIIITGVAAAIGCIFINRDLTVIQALLGGAIAGGVFLLIFLITKGGVGIGDAKLIGCAGLFLGLDKVLSAVLISVILSGLMGILLFIVNKQNRKKAMPFAPFILAGTVLALLL